MIDRGKHPQLLASAAQIAVVLALAGCGGQVVDQSGAEQAVGDEVERALRVDVNTVSCPAEVKIEIDERFTCQVNQNAEPELEAEIKVTSENADLQLIGVDGR